MKYNLAFTIVELMVAIAVIAVCLALATPSFTQIIRKNQLHRSAVDFIENLNKTRSNAILKKTKSVLLIGEESGWTPINRDVEWNEAKKPSSTITFDYLGRVDLNENFHCYILQNSIDNQLKKIIILQKNGMVTLDQALTNCPSLITGG